MSLPIKTKIIATIGPVTNSAQKLADLAAAGVNVFRLNLSHGDHAWHADLITKIKTLRKETYPNIAIWLDTKGPEVRIQTLEKPLTLKKGQIVTLGKENEADIGISYVGLADDAKKGDEILIEGGIVVFEVQKTDTKKQRITVEVTRGGEITSKRHVTLRGERISLASITQQDWKDLKFGLEQGVDGFAVSFVRDDKDIFRIREFISKHVDINENNPPKIIAKVETAAAMDDLYQIIAASDGIMVARGDLGAETPFSELPIKQKQIIIACQKAHKPVIVATEMLQSMVENPIPTRAEVTDVHLAVTQKADAIMLSAETAAGNYPIVCVETMTEIAQKAEQVTQSNLYDAKRAPWDCMMCNTREEIARLGVKMAHDLPQIEAIVVMTKSGKMAELVSGFKPSVPVIACCKDKKVLPHLAHFFAVYGVLVDFNDENPEKTVQSGFAEIKKAHPSLNNKNVVLISESLNGKEKIPMLQARIMR